MSPMEHEKPDFGRIKSESRSFRMAAALSALFVITPVAMAVSACLDLFCRVASILLRVLRLPLVIFDDLVNAGRIYATVIRNNWRA